MRPSCNLPVFDRESGKGRSDLLVKPVRRSREAPVVGFKVTKDFDELNCYLILFRQFFHAHPVISLPGGLCVPDVLFNYIFFR